VRPWRTTSTRHAPSGLTIASTTTPKRYPFFEQVFYPGTVAEYQAVAQWWERGTFTLLVLRASDGHEVWGDSVTAASFDDIPRAASARLQGPVAYRTTGGWRQDGEEWRADVALKAD